MDNEIYVLKGNDCPHGSEPWIITVSLDLQFCLDKAHEFLAGEYKEYNNIYATAWVDVYVDGKYVRTINILNTEGIIDNDKQ
jgi:hypothetical protein